MIDEVDRIVQKLEEQPGAGYLKLVSSGKKRLYRACLVKKRFELIYYYQESTDTVFVADFWDAKMNPDKLERRLGNI